MRPWTHTLRRGASRRRWLARRALLLASCAVLLTGCGGTESTGGSERWDSAHGASVAGYTPVYAVGVNPADWPYFDQPSVALGPPGGLLDVVSLGYEPAAGASLGGSLVLGLGLGTDPADRVCASDGAGADLVVYENAFRIDAGVGVNTEAVVVEVAESATGPWYGFDPQIDPACADLADPACYTHLAGVTPTAEGGDAFDLADAIAANALPADFQACYVRLTDGGTLWADYGNTQADQYASGADIDAVAALHHVPAPGLVP